MPTAPTLARPPRRDPLADASQAAQSAGVLGGNQHTQDLQQAQNQPLSQPDQQGAQLSQGAPTTTTPRQSPQADAQSMLNAAIGNTSRAVRPGGGLHGGPIPALHHAPPPPQPGGLHGGPVPAIHPPPGTPNVFHPNPPNPGRVPPNQPQPVPPGNLPGGKPPPGNLPPKGPPPFNIPLVPADEAAKARALTDFGSSSADAMAAIQAAAMGYGDTSLMSEWGLNPAPNPNSTLALAALRAQQQQQADENNRERSGAFFSSLMGQDLSNVASSQQRADLGGYQRYQNSLGNFNRAITLARNTLINAVNAANADERQQAINTLPTAANTGSGGFEGGSTKINTKVPSGTQKPAGAPKGGSVKPPSIPKTKSHQGKISVPKGPQGKGKVGGVKKAQRVPGKRR